MKLIKVTFLTLLFVVLGGAGFLFLSNPEVKTEEKVIHIDLSDSL